MTNPGHLTHGSARVLRASRHYVYLPDFFYLKVLRLDTSYLLLYTAITYISYL